MSIYALSSGPGVSGIAVIRISGKETAEVPGGEAGSQFDDSFLDSDVGRGSGYETFLTGSFV